MKHQMPHLSATLEASNATVRSVPTGSYVPLSCAVIAEVNFSIMVPFLRLYLNRESSSFSNPLIGVGGLIKIGVHSLTWKSQVVICFLWDC